MDPVVTRRGAVLLFKYLLFLPCIEALTAGCSFLHGSYVQILIVGELHFSSLFGRIESGVTWLHVSGPMVRQDTLVRRHRKDRRAADRKLIWP